MAREFRERQGKIGEACPGTYKGLIIVSCFAGTENQCFTICSLMAIRDIVREPSAREKLIEKGVVSRLVRLLKDTPKKQEAAADMQSLRSWLEQKLIQEEAANALSALCCCQPAVAATVAGLGAIPQLLELADTYQVYHRIYRVGNRGYTLTNEGFAAARLLCTLADEPAAKAVMIEAGVIPILVGLFNNHDNSEMVVAAATLLKVADVPPVKAKMSSKSIIPWEELLTRPYWGHHEHPSKHGLGALAVFLADGNNIGALHGAQVVQVREVVDRLMETLNNSLISSLYQPNQQAALLALAEFGVRRQPEHEGFGAVPLTVGKVCSCTCFKAVLPLMASI